MANAHDKTLRLYLTADLATDNELTLNQEQSHYLSNVMRLENGDVLRVFNAKQGEWQARISHIGKKAVTLTAQTQRRKPEASRELWLYCAPIKRNHFDFMVMKATELGVSHIQPMLTAHTQVREVNTERCNAIATEAAEQSERLSVPTICEAATFQNLMENLPSHLLPLFCAEFGASQPVHKVMSSIHKKAEAAIIIGPEGGFSADEMNLMHKLPNAVAIRLGSRILRADTAAIAALSCWQAIAGDWQDATDDIK